MSSKLPTLIVSCCFVFLIGSAAVAQEPDVTKWTNAQGATIEAEFVRMDEDGVVLKLKSNGQQATVPLSTLSLESHLMAIKLAKPAEFSKPLVKAPIAEVVEAPELVIPDYQAASVSPFNESQSLQQFVETLTGELDRGNLYVIWHAIPEKMQEDMLPLMLQSAEQFGEDNYSKVGEVIKAAHTLLKEKKEFVFANKTLMERKELRKTLYSYWDVAEKMVAALDDDELWVMPTEENFEKLNAKTACVYGAELIFLKELISQEAGFPIPAFSSLLGVASAKEDVGRIRIQLPIPIPMDDVTARKVNGRWVIPAIMNPLRKGLDEAPNIEEDPQMKQVQAQVNSGLNMGKLLLDQFAAAETQEDFDKAMDQYGPMIFSGLEMLESSAGANPLAGMLGGMGGIPGMGGPGRGGNQGFGAGNGQGNQGFANQGGGRRGGGLGAGTSSGASSPGGGRRGGGLGVGSGNRGGFRGGGLGTGGGS